MGIFITLEEPSRDMLSEGATSGFYHSPGWGPDYPRIQIYTIEGLLYGAQVKIPPTQATFKQTSKVKADDGVIQPRLDLE